jgi:hypothetical protein
MRRSSLALLALACAALFSHATGSAGTASNANAGPQGQPGASPSPDFSAARELIKGAQYDEAIKQLKSVILSTPPEATTEKEAKKLLQIAQADDFDRQVSQARQFIAEKNYDKAEETLSAALDRSPADVPGRKEAEALIADLRARSAQIHQLADARRLISDWKFDAAAPIIKDVLDKAKDREVVADAVKAQGELRAASESLLPKLFGHYSGILWIILDIILAVVLGFGLLLLARKIYSKRRTNKWLIFGIDDPTGLGVGEAVVESLRRWNDPNPVFSGLVKLEMLHVASVPNLEAEDSLDLDFAPALQSLPLQFGGVSLGSLASAFGPLRRWFHATRPWIRGSALATDAQVIVRLTRRDASGTTLSVTASADKARFNEAAESASYMMYYLIANKEKDTADAGVANSLRVGLNLLRQYVNKRDPAKLSEAYEACRAARNENPGFEEAYLYEGIALDLLELHDEAIKRFHYLVENTANDELRERALSNEAIARFRKYRPEEIEESIRILDQVLAGTNTPHQFAKSPSKSLALATKANALAHKPIFWQYFLFGNLSADREEIIRRKEQGWDKMGAWIDGVDNISAFLVGLEEHIGEGQSGWDELTRRQLEWARLNARGNVRLNYAMHALGKPLPEDVDVADRRKALLGEAYEAFQKCEMLLPPGVETLTNLATVLSELGKETEARLYLQSAIELNKGYEYAYYRMARSWDKQDNTEEVLNVLRSFSQIKNPSIPSFINIYKKYGPELAKSGATVS